MTLSNDHLSLEFSERTGGIEQIAAPPSGHVFIRKALDRPPFWRLHLRGTDGHEATVASADVAPSEVRRTATQLALEWKRVELPGEGPVLDVRATCRVTRDAAYLRLWVRNRSKTAGLWTVEFPVIGSLSETGAPDVASRPRMWANGTRSATPSDIAAPR